MQAKALEIRDEGTFIPALAVDMNPPDAIRAPDGAQRYLLRRCGYRCDGRPNIALTRLDASGARCSNDPYFWEDRTWTTAHRYIIDNWAELVDGSVIDVQFILGETKAPKLSESLTTAI